MIGKWLSKRSLARQAALDTAALDRRQGIWLLGAAALTLAPHANWLPVWISSLCAVLFAWRGVLLWRGSQPPPWIVLLFLTIAAAVGIRAEFAHFFGKDPGVALLALLLGLKLLEIRSARDIRTTVLLCFFLQLALFFEDQSLPIAVLALCATLLALTALVALSDPHGSDRARLRVAVLLMAQGIPFMLVLFVLFPRIEGPLWGLPADAFGARTGLSDTMSPGSISELGESGEIALRALFVGEPPPRPQRYWRGPVLTQFDGRTWRTVPAAEAATPFYTPAGARIDYTLTLEPHNQRWLLALDFPGTPNPPLRHTSDYQLLDRRPVQTRTRLELSAYPDTPVGQTETAATLQTARQLPAGFNPRTLALAAELSADSASPEQIVQRAIAHLRAAQLSYTLNPPLLGTHSVDEFLFDTRRGFCEHFASAFAVLMRAAGVPARVVTGYQGGEINPIDRHLVVRQLDAHAWTEVWLGDRGWVRIDPTYVSAPRRIDDGLAAALPYGEALPFTLRIRNDWLRSMRLRWEALSNAWNQRVLGYNLDRQRELLSRLGLDHRDTWALAGTLAVGAALLFLGLFAWANRKRTAADPLDRVWQALSARLTVRGLGRYPWEGPQDYTHRVSSALPELEATLRAIGDDYARLRYGPHPDDAQVLALKRKINALRLP